MKKTAITALKIAVSLGLYVYIFRKIDIGHLKTILQDASITYFGLAILVYFLIQGLSAYRWYLLLQPLGIEIGYGKLLRFYLLGMFFNNFMPTGIGGDVFRVYYLNKETGKLGRSTTSVFLDRDFGMTALLLMATVVAAIAGTAIKGILLAPIFVLIGLAFAGANLALFYRPTYNLLHKLLALFKMKEADQKVERLFQSVNSYRGKWKLIAVVMILSLIVQFGCSVVNMLTAESIGMHTTHGWMDYVVFIPAIGLISMMPVSVNGMGWREFSYIFFFSQVVVDSSRPAELSSALAFLWLGVLLVTSLPGAIIYMLQGSRKESLPAGNEVLEAK